MRLSVVGDIGYYREVTIGSIRGWRHMRAALIAAHIVAMGLFALPRPAAISSANDFRTIQVQGELVRWGKRLGLPPSELRRQVRIAMIRYSQVYPRLVEPIEPYRGWVGVRQGWHLFSAGPKNPHEVHVAIDTGGGFRTIRVTGDADHDWRETQLRHHRVRKIERKFWRTTIVREWYGWSNWCAERAFEDSPSARAVRVRQVRWETPAPGDATGTHPPGRVVRERVIEREARP